MATHVTFTESHLDAPVMLCAAEGWPSWTHARLFERIDLLSADEPLPFYESLPHRRKPGVRIYA